jgi:hypothetical protein
MLIRIDWPRQQREKQTAQPRKGRSVGKEIEREVHEGEIVDEEPQSNGIPAARYGGSSHSNEGKSITDWRAGRGAV